MIWHIWTDGSCQHGLPQVPRGTLGWGGWCAIVEHGSDGLVLRGREPDTTNVRMELRAAIEGLRVVPVGEDVVLHTDCTTILCARDASKRGGRSRNPHKVLRDGELWKELGELIAWRTVHMHLIVKGERDKIHRRAHVIAGAEARGGLCNLPTNATPLDELGGGHRIRSGYRRQAANASVR